ncbi:MBL fold metallo-hydrolase [Shewanella sp. 202IG2-18]|uniref:AVAST type 1 anti-phage system MBL fold metallo-hydrolase Avs1a n=1 Tax=Parashewanella hymeniacidonis TaxID=2807618 RepID=UPI001961B086|nr:AVAST type 1 anti-phage system MBL fold metallo-hydrolase Avs1a [Parashewanella hymeniacidonis]MBM7072756.1 MBL fold metallo-hydrolase [Parashewanella hymeniacidonis]
MLNVRMYPAQNGDAFLVSSNGTNLLIDGGYAKTFNNHILSDLREKASKGECLDLVIATHIDSDHILGLIRFLSQNGSSLQPQIIPVKNIWHNSLRNLTAPCESIIVAEDLELLKAINRRGHPTAETENAANPKEISARQGSTFSSLIHQGKYLWNGSDGTKSISLENIHNFSISGDNIRVLSPSKQRLEDLLKSWKKDLQKYGYKGTIGSGAIIDDAFEFSFEHRCETQKKDPTPVSGGRRKTLEEIYKPDDSPTNGSSIATIVELGGARLLMLADAWAEDIIEVLSQLKSTGCSMMFDAIKISHHGSFHNTSPELLKLVDAPMYFISSNGNTHGHPDIELLTAIVDRPADFSRTLYFNYSTPASNELIDYKTQTGASFLVCENATDWIQIQEN